MNKQEILTEGYLAAYVTGELDAQQIEEIDVFIKSDDDVRREYFQIQRIVELLAFDRAVTPPAKIKAMIMEQVAKRSSLTSSKTTLNYLVAASVTIAILSAIAGVYYRSEWKSTQQELAQLNIRNQEIADGFQFVSQELEVAKVELSVTNSPDYKRIILQGTDNAKDAQTVLFWNPNTQGIYLNSASLAALPKGKQYQLWALKDGQPIDAGVFDAKEGDFQIMKNIAQADAFAVTIEVTGGAESPTLSTMQVFASTS
ncbi:anti-sigma factor [Reichenbachiella agarivorans]|uniref:Anti-sigma factor n=1 Tax=Reichenbachiella agarivorans TaxID=2979464 RepID=A0ABY6CQU7_9BACT|nr:anti-sigma factor [Reichenbachiella agarivorans]UXP31823.1 anti-sigma factor [Reichenbachiella agarivorans]